MLVAAPSFICNPAASALISHRLHVFKSKALFKRCTQSAVGTAGQLCRRRTKETAADGKVGCYIDLHQLRILVHFVGFPVLDKRFGFPNGSNRKPRNPTHCGKLKNEKAASFRLDFSHLGVWWPNLQLGSGL